MCEQSGDLVWTIDFGTGEENKDCVAMKEWGERVATMSTGRKPEGLTGLGKTGVGGSCVTHGLGDLVTHESAVARYPGFSRRDLGMLTSADWRHGISYEGFVSPRFSLHVWCHDLCVFAEVAFEGFALPPSFGFDDIKGNPS